MEPWFSRCHEAERFHEVERRLMSDLMTFISIQFPTLHFIDRIPSPRLYAPWVPPLATCALPRLSGVFYLLTTYSTLSSAQGRKTVWAS